MIRVLYNIHCITRHRDPTLPLPLRYILFNQRGFFQHVLHLSDAHIRRKKKKKKFSCLGKFSRSAPPLDRVTRAWKCGKFE